MHITLSLDCLIGACSQTWTEEGITIKQPQSKAVIPRLKNVVAIDIMHQVDHLIAESIAQGRCTQAPPPQ